MSLFDDIKTKAEELLGGGVEDVTNQVSDLGQQAQDLKDNILPGGGQDDSSNSDNNES